MLKDKYMKKIEGHNEYHYLRRLINRIYEDNHVCNTYEYKYRIIDLILNDLVIIE